MIRLANVAGLARPIGWSKLKDDECAFLERSRRLVWLNALNPMAFTLHHVSFGETDANALVQYVPAPFGGQIELHVLLRGPTAGWTIVEHNDKSNPESKNKKLAEGKAEFDPKQTYTLMLECKGNDVAAQINGKAGPYRDLTVTRTVHSTRSVTQHGPRSCR